MTPYAKTPQTNEDIAAILESRGLAFDKEQLLAFLAKVGYYRLKGYLVPFRQPDKVDFIEGADFATVKAIYDFDANLRTVSGKGLAIVEVAVRAAITRYHLAWKSDPFLYKDAANLPGLKEKAYEKLMAHIGDAVAKSKSEPFMRHLAVEHGIVDCPPLWTLMEVIPFGTLANYYQGLPPEVQEKVANSFNVIPSVFVGFLTALRRTRNVCAHHARLWNRRFGSMISRKIGLSKGVAALDACFKADDASGFDSVFDILSVTRHLVKVVDPSSPWLADIASVVTDATPFILTGMGFPSDWQSLALWKEPEPASGDSSASAAPAPTAG